MKYKKQFIQSLQLLFYTFMIDDLLDKLEMRNEK